MPVVNYKKNDYNSQAKDWDPSMYANRQPMGQPAKVNQQQMQMVDRG